MATPINYADLQLQSTTNRLVEVDLSNNVIVASVKSISLFSSNSVFYIDPLGTPEISFINISTIIKNIDNPTVVWEVVSGTGTLTNTSNSGCTITYANMSTNSITIQASITTPDLEVYSSVVTINKIQQGVTWSNISAKNSELGPEKIAIGKTAGIVSQSLNAIAIGTNSGNSFQSQYALSLGYNSGYSNQGASSIAIGKNSGYTSQSTTGIAIGTDSGNNNQGQSAIALGTSAGNSAQSSSSIAVGTSAGFSNQGQYAVAIGNVAGYTGQGTNAIAIGNNAGVTNQPNNTIVINASGATLNSTQQNSLVVSPVRNVAGLGELLHYNSTTKEISYSSIQENSASVDNILHYNTTSKELRYIPTTSFIKPPIMGLLTDNWGTTTASSDSVLLHGGSLSNFSTSTTTEALVNYSASTANLFTAKSWFFMPCMFKNTATYTGLGIFCKKTAAGSAASTVRALIYSNNATYDTPGSMLYDWGTAQTTYGGSDNVWLTGSYTFNSRVQYWIAIIIDGSSADFVVSAITSPIATGLDMRFNTFTKAKPSNSISISTIEGSENISSKFGVYNTSGSTQSYSTLPPSTNPSIYFYLPTTATPVKLPLIALSS